MMVPPAGHDDARATGAICRLAPGTRLAHYEIQVFIASGGMGEVYRGKDTRLGRTVAIKVLPPEAAFDQDRCRRFEQEARAVSALNHPHICVVHDFACESPVLEQEAAGGSLPSPVHFLVMEFLEGQTLAERLKKGPLPPAQALEYGAQIADALHAAHRQGILHRDVKPGNVMLTRNGAKLMDFGLARLTVPSDPLTTTATHTNPGTVLGTVPYMAPEQLEGRAIDARTDIFAFGALLHEMLTGQRAFQGSSPVSVMTAVLEHDPPPVTSLQALAPPLVDRVVATCLAKDPDKRLDSAHDVAEQLRWIATASETEKAGRLRATELLGRWWPIAAGVVGLAALAPSIVQHFAGTRAPAVSVVPRQITTSAAWDTDPAISPDGMMVAYTSGETGIGHIRVADVAEGTSQCLTCDNPAGDSSPTWYRDGARIAYVSKRDGTRGIWTVARLGGSSRLVVPDAQDPAISHDGKSIAFVRANASGELRIMVAPLADPDAARPITRAGDADGLWDHRDPAWSLDDKTICYRAQRDLWLAPVTGAGARQLTADGESDLEPEWSSDGQYVLFASLRQGTVALWRVPAKGGRPMRVTSGTGSPERHPSVSRDGKRMVYTTSLDNFDLVLMERSTGRTKHWGGVRSEFHPTLSPDGRTLFFVSDMQGKFDLWSLSLNGIEPQGQAVRLTDYEGSVSMPSCSPDGKWVALGHTERNQREILIISSLGGPPSHVTDRRSVALEPSWSPDGSEIAFLSDKSGTNRIWVVPVANGRSVGPARQLMPGKNPQELPAWSPDGSRIAFVSTEGTGGRDVWVVDVNGTAPTRITRGAEPAAVRWLAPDRLLVSGLWGGVSFGLREVSVPDGALLARYPDSSGRTDPAGLFDVSRGGGIVVYTWEERRGNIWLLEAASRIY